MDRGSLKIRVVDAKNKPVAKATVTIAEKSYETDSRGECSPGPLPQGSFTVQAAAGGFDSGRNEAYVSDGEEALCIVRLISTPIPEVAEKKP